MAYLETERMKTRKEGFHVSVSACRTFASALMVDSGLVVECATLANTINSKKGLKARFSCLKTMQGLPDYTVLSGHPQTVSILRWSTDASHIATACRADAVVRLFDACSGAMVLSIRTHPSSGRLGHVSDLHFVSESAVVTASLGGEVKIWSAEHGELLAYLQGPIFDLDVQPEAPAGALLAVSVQAGVVAVTDQSFIAKAWDVGTRELIGRCKAKSRWTRPGKDLLLPTAEAWLPELHPSGNLLAVAELARSSNAFVYDLASGDVVFDVPESLLERRTTAMEFSADGAFFLLGTDTAITVWSTADWEDVAHLPLNPLGTGVPTPPGVRKSKSREHTVLAGMEMMGEHHLVACWGTEGVGWRVRRWDLREKVLADASAESWEHSTEGFKAKRLRMCSAADHVLVVDSSGAVRRCNVFEASGPARFIGHMNGSPHCLAGAPEAVAVASGTKVRVWPSAKKRAGSSEDQGPPTKSPMEPPAAITVATADAEHDLVAVGSRDGTLRFRNADGGWGSRTWGRFGRDEAVETMFLKVHDKPIISIAICGSADGRGSLVATAGGDSIAITDVTERKRVAELRAADAGGSPGPAIYVDMRQGGDVMAAFASGVAFCRWDTAKRDLCVSRFIPASAPITAVSWSADGKELLAASATGADIAVSLRSCETEESLGEWQCAHEVSSIAISHDRQRMACVGRRPAALGNDDNASLSVWLRTDLALRRLRYHLTSSSSDLPPSVAFSRDNYVVTGPRPVCVWNTMGAGASEEIVAPVLSILDLPSLARSMGAPGTHVSPCLLVAGAPDIDASAVCHISVPESSWYRFKSAARRLAPALSCAAAGGPCVAIALTSSQPDLKRRSIAHHEDRRDLQAAHNDGGGENAEKLQAACMESDFSAVSSLLKYDVTAAFCVDSHGWSPLDYAVRARSGEVIRALLEAGGERVRAESSMRRALWSSCECGFAEAVQLLAQSPMMSETDIDGASLLHAAVGSGDLETVRAVIEAGGNASVCSADWRGQTPLHIAAEVGKIELVRCLLAAGARSGQGDSAGETPLISAARWGHVGIVRELVEGGADRGAQNRTGETALHVAVQTAEGNSRELVDLLIQGAEGDLVNVERDGAVRVLHLAVLRRHAWLVQALIDAGAELDCPVHCAVNGVQEGSTPLLMAITLGDPEIAAVLARGGADVNRPFASGPQAGTTPIFWAATKKSAAMVKLLAEAGADVNCKNESGITPLLLACDGGDLEMAEALTSAGADASIRVEKTVMSINSSQMNQRDETEGFLRGDSALHCAISRGATDVAVHLIKSGAPIEIRTATMEDCEHPVGVGDARSPDFGATPLLRALHRGNSAVVSALLDAGADVMAADQYGVSALEVACSFGSNYIFDHKEEAAAHVEALVKAGAWRGQMGGQVPIIFLPIITANIELLKLMLSEGADASVQAFGRTTLHIALMADDQRTSYKAPESDTKGDIVEVLLAAGADADMPSSKEEDEVVCPLHLAADLGHTRIAKQLLAAGASCRCATSPGGLTPLHIAAAKCAHGVLDALIAAGADVHARNDVSDTPLLHAIRTTTAASSRPREARSVSESSHLDVIQELLKAGADPCAGGADGKTPLALIASGAAFPSTASLLLAAGARAADDDVFALLNRAFTDTAVAADILGAVLASGFDLSRHDGLGKTALHLAHSLFIKALATAGKQAYGETWAAVEERRQKILEGFAAVLQITSDNGAPVNAVDREGRSIADLLALEVVAAGRNGGQRWMGWSRIGAGKSERDMLVVVLEKGGKLEQNLGAHCLVAAASGLDASLTRALLGSGARPELTGDGLHALHALAEAAFETHGSQEKSRESFQETLAMLLGAGADVDTPRPADGYTPLMIAIRSGPSDEGSFKVEQLLKSGASGSSVGADGDTVLHVAIKSGFAANAGAFDSLLKAGASASAGVMGAEGRRPIGLLGAWHYPRRSVLETLEAMGGKATAKERSIIMLELLQKGLGDPDFLSALLEESECDSSVTDAEGNTALHLAAGRRDLVQQGDVISLLVGCGLSATAVNHSGKSPLALLGDELPNGLSPSRQAAFGTAKSASALVMAGADPGPLAPKLLGIAAASSDVRLIKSLTTQWGATASAPVDSSGATALHAIAALGAAGEPLTECIELLLAAGGKPNATADSGAAGGDGETDTGATPAGVPSPLLLALRNKNGGDIIAPVLVKAGMLLDKGEPMLWKVLSEACQGERGRVPERVLAVVQTGVVDGEDGAQSLCAAAMLQCPGLIELLLSRGVSPDAGILPGTEISSMLQAQIGEACNGMSCVHLAVIGANGGSIDALEALLKAGANVDARDGAMATPLHWAARLGLGTAVEALLRKGANPDAVASKGWTPLGLAAGVGSLETVQALVKGGCNKSLESSEPNVEGEPVLATEIARRNGHSDIVVFLQTG